jgi:DNA-binding PadR family transcriptional regulator
VKMENEKMDDKELDEAILENIRNGFIKSSTCEDGSLIFRITEKGQAYVQALLKENPNLYIEMGLEDGL